MVTTQQQSVGEYQVRPYRPTDRDRFLSLYETVWGRRKSVDWFNWRFEANPYRDGVQMTVVESDGELVGAEPLLPYRLRIGETVHDVFQPVDWIVHPDHRRQGLFTRMTKATLDRHLTDVSLFFNFPNEQLRPGLEQFDWETVGSVACRYRVQNPRAFVDRTNADHSAIVALAARVGTPVCGVGLNALDWLASAPEEITIERSSGVRIDAIHDLYSSTRPTGTHVVRDRPFLKWRFANPNWETTSYVAVDDGETVGSLIAATEQTDEARICYLFDLQPMQTAATRPAAVEALLGALLEDTTDVDLIRAPTGYFPGLFRRYGFCRDDAFPLSTATTRTTHAIRTPVMSGASTETATQPKLSAEQLGDPDCWQLTLADLDVE